jgi:Fe-S oxidoreductase
MYGIFAMATLTQSSIQNIPPQEMKIGLFMPCSVDLIYPKAGIATLELLEQFGLQVDYPLNQTCCGQPMSNSGDQANARGAEQLFVDILKGYDCIIGPAGSCVKEVRCHYDTMDQTALGCFTMGPSATGDVEATMVHGAQGPRTLNVLFMAGSDPA